MAATEILRIREDLAEQIRRHGVETYPHECCGALLGLDSSSSSASAPREVLALLRLVNRSEDSPRNRFSVTPDDVRAAESAARSQRLELLGWYHSHPDHPARPSEYDREHAWPWYSYIIVSIHNAVPRDFTSWRLAGDRTRFSEERIEFLPVAVAAGKPLEVKKACP